MHRDTGEDLGDQREGGDESAMGGRAHGGKTNAARGRRLGDIPRFPAEMGTFPVS